VSMFRKFDRIRTNGGNVAGAFNSLLDAPKISHLVVDDSHTYGHSLDLSEIQLSRFEKTVSVWTR
jgi:hypothetical protein